MAQQIRQGRSGLADGGDVPCVERQTRAHVGRAEGQGIQSVAQFGQADSAVSTDQNFSVAGFNSTTLSPIDNSGCVS